MIAGMPASEKQRSGFDLQPTLTGDLLELRPLKLDDFGALFAAASDPQIQVWRPDMYEPVKASAKKHFQTEQLTSAQVNAEFWILARANYRKHWRFHRDRLWHNVLEIARFTPARSTPSTPASERWRTVLKWSLTVTLGTMALVRRRWFSAGAVIALGATWANWPQSHLWLVIAASALGLVALGFGQRSLFLWTAYWWVGVLALYLTGGTWGPPLGPTWDMNALGYRLGFQFFFLIDLLVIGLLGCVALGLIRAPASTVADHPIAQPVALNERIARTGLLGFLALLAAVLGTGIVIVTLRLVTRNRLAPVPYPDLSALATLDAARGATPLTDLTPLRVAINAHTGAPLVTRGMSSGFIWNLPGQERCMLLLYQQDKVRPVHMSPRNIYVEISRQIPDREWMNRQGAWVIRSFPNTAQNSNLPYYLEMPAVQAFVPLTGDGRSYDLSQAVIFPLAKSATDLVAAGDLTVRGASPEWAMNSGALKAPRRFALHGASSTQAIELLLNLTHAQGARSFRFGVQLEAAAGQAPRPVPVQLRLGATGSDGPALWQADLVPATAAPVWVDQAPSRATTGLRLSIEHLQPADTLWFYELVLTADDFTH